MSDTTSRSAVPTWFWVVAALLTLWGAAGCYNCYLQWTMGGAAWGDTGYDRALYASMPGWYDWVFLIAAGAGFLGGVALLARSRLAQALFLTSLIAVLVQFGWLFATTDIVAAKGVATTVPFPAFITVVAAFSVWFAGYASNRGWVR